MTVCVVTGGTGFLGRRIVARLLAAGWTVRVPSRKPPEMQNDQGRSPILIPADLLDPASLRSALAETDVLVHAAGEKRDLRAFNAVNVEGTRSIIDVAGKVGTGSVVLLSSVGVIGHTRLELVTEETPCAPGNAYERSKYAGEQVARELCERYAIPLTVLRPANVFGDDDPECHLLKLIRSIARGWFVFAGGRQSILNYVYVGDVAEAVWAVLNEPLAAEQTFIVSDPCTLEEFVSVIAHEVGRPIPPASLPLPLAFAAAAVADVVGTVLRRPLPITLEKVRAAQSRRIVSADKLRRLIVGWPVLGWQEGLRRTIDWYRRQGLI